MTTTMGWMQVYTGAACPMEMTPDNVDIRDIAHSLSMLCRYGGHCEEFYSVAEHSYLVSYMVPSEYALQGLLHDATEAYLVDMPRPRKRMLSQYRELETALWRPIAEKFCLPQELHPCIKRADDQILLSEREQNMKEPAFPWGIEDDGRRVQLQLWDNKRAEKMFLKRFRELTNTQTRWEGACNWVRAWFAGRVLVNLGREY